MARTFIISQTSEDSENSFTRSNCHSKPYRRRAYFFIKNSRLRIILVVHSNHASELDDFTCSKLLQLSEHHITVLNQAVLLKGVNDSAQTLTDLSYRLFEARVMPYYLHVLDKVKGAQHFDLIPSEIDAIYQDVLASLPGYLVPKLVREIAGEKNKTPLLGLQLLSYIISDDE